MWHKDGGTRKGCQPGQGAAARIRQAAPDSLSLSQPPARLTNPEPRANSYESLCLADCLGRHSGRIWAVRIDWTKWVTRAHAGIPQ